MTSSSSTTTSPSSASSSDNERTTQHRRRRRRRRRQHAINSTIPVSARHFFSLFFHVHVPFSKTKSNKTSSNLKFKQYLNNAFTAFFSAFTTFFSASTPSTFTLLIIHTIKQIRGLLQKIILFIVHNKQYTCAILGLTLGLWSHIQTQTLIRDMFHPIHQACRAMSTHRTDFADSADTADTQHSSTLFQLHPHEPRLGGTFFGVCHMTQFLHELILHSGGIFTWTMIASLSIITALIMNVEAYRYQLHLHYYLLLQSQTQTQTKSQYHETYHGTYQKKKLNKYYNALISWMTSCTKNRSSTSTSTLSSKHYHTCWWEYYTCILQYPTIVGILSQTLGFSIFLYLWVPIYCLSCISHCPKIKNDNMKYYTYVNMLEHYYFHSNKQPQQSKPQNQQQKQPQKQPQKHLQHDIHDLEQQQQQQPPTVPQQPISPLSQPSTPTNTNQYQYHQQMVVPQPQTIQWCSILPSSSSSSYSSKSRVCLSFFMSLSFPILTLILYTFDSNTYTWTVTAGLLGGPMLPIFVFVLSLVLWYVVTPIVLFFRRVIMKKSNRMSSSSSSSWNCSRYDCNTGHDMDDDNYQNHNNPNSPSTITATTTSSSSTIIHSTMSTMEEVNIELSNALSSAYYITTILCFIGHVLNVSYLLSIHGFNVTSIWSEFAWTSANPTVAFMTIDVGVLFIGILLYISVQEYSSIYIHTHKGSSYGDGSSNEINVVGGGGDGNSSINSYNKNSYNPCCSGSSNYNGLKNVYKAICWMPFIGPAASCAFVLAKLEKKRALIGKDL